MSLGYWKAGVAQVGLAVEGEGTSVLSKRKGAMLVVGTGKSVAVCECTKARKQTGNHLLRVKEIRENVEV